jgi:hypothetical protein
MILNYKFRGNYLNYKTICYLLGSEENKNKFPGFLPVEVDYPMIDGTNCTIKLTNRESLFFCKNNDKYRKQILELIILSRSENVEAKIELKQILDKFIKSQKQYYNNISFKENDNMISSSTNTIYTADQVSHKGVNLLNLIKEGYPVPDFSILTSNSYFLNYNKRKKNIKDAIENLEKMTRKKLDSGKNPLIFAIRSAMPSYIPGVTPTYLNVGITKQSYKALCKIYSQKVAKKIYLNNLQTINHCIFGDDNNSILIDNKNIEYQINTLYSQIAKKDEKLLTDAFYQVLFFVSKTHEFFTDNEDLLLTFFRDKGKFPSLILQKMVWTILDDESYPGVLYSRHSRTGLGIQIESLPNIFGDEIMTGLVDAHDHEFFNRDSIKPLFPAVYHFEPLVWRLEKKLQSPVIIEFAAEGGGNGDLFAVLQLNEAEITGRAILLSSIDLYKNGIIDDKRVIELINPYHLNQIFSDRIDSDSFQSLKYFCNGVSILPRTAVSVRIFFSATKALEAKRNRDKVAICKKSFIPADTLVMGEVDAIISFTPAAIHVITACRSYGVPAFLNLEKFGVKLTGNKMINKSGLVIYEGDWITISSKRQKIFLGKAHYESARFQHYLDGEKFEMPIKEERVFINMSKAFIDYNKLVANLQLEKIVKIDELIKLVNNNMRNKPKKAATLINSWFDVNTELYVNQILESEMGSHQDQHKLYKMFTLNNKIRFFKRVISICRKNNLKGFSAGSFMLGRFLCNSHSVEFWNAFIENDISCMLNEYILFEKYMNVLNQVGEREVNRARKKILSERLGNINLHIGDAMIFVTLKLSKKKLIKIKEFATNNKFDQETIALINLLMKPYGKLYDFNNNWSVSNLQKLCKEASLTLPKPSDI